MIVLSARCFSADFSIRLPMRLMIRKATAITASAMSSLMPTFVAQLTSAFAAR